MTGLRHPVHLAFFTLLLCIPGLVGCGGETSTAHAAELGLIIRSDDPAHAGMSPEEMEAQGVRPYFHDFGVVRLGDSVRHIFPLVNTDAAPVRITRLQASCNCTKAELTFTDAEGNEVRHRTSSRGGEGPLIPPGVEAELAMWIDTNHSEPTSHNTDKLYTVQMATDSPNRGYLRFEAHIYIERAFQATPQPLDLGRVPRSGGAVGTIDIIPVGDVGARLVNVGPLPPGVLAELVAEPQYGQTLWKLQVTLEPPLEPGPIRHTFELMTEDTEELPYFPFPIEVHAHAVDDIDHSPQRVTMRNAGAAEGPIESTVDLY